jgi:hypothetical protein
MNYYFMPRHQGLTSEVTLINYPPRTLAQRGGQQETTKIAQVAWSDGQAWIIRALGDVEADRTLCVSSTDIASYVPAEALPVLFLSALMHEGRHARLPDLPVMDTVPAWRANILMRSATTAASYQGDYPSGMTKLASATLLSIAPLMQFGSGISTDLLFVNILADPAITEHEIRITPARTRRALKSAKVYANRCTVLPLDDLADEEGLQVVSCRSMTGIPIYFSYDRDFSQMSLEHSHPPVEAVVFGDRGSVSRALKTAWLSGLTS